MLHRLIQTGDLFSHLLEGMILCVVTAHSGFTFLAELISNQDWDRLTGPSGVAFASSVATLVLWGTGVVVVRRLRLDAIDRELRHRQDEQAREERLRQDRTAHFDDLKESNRMVVERLIEITTANHEVMLAGSRTDMRVAESIHSLETQIQQLANTMPRQHHKAS